MCLQLVINAFRRSEVKHKLSRLMFHTSCFVINAFRRSEVKHWKYRGNVELYFKVINAFRRSEVKHKIAEKLAGIDNTRDQRLSAIRGKTREGDYAGTIFAASL